MEYFVLAYRIVFFFNDTATTEIYTLSLHDALPIYGGACGEATEHFVARQEVLDCGLSTSDPNATPPARAPPARTGQSWGDRDNAERRSLRWPAASFRPSAAAPPPHGSHTHPRPCAGPLRGERKSFSDAATTSPARPNNTWIPGDWISVSMTATRRPDAASSVARFAVILDLPVPPRKERIETIVAIRSLHPGARVRALNTEPAGCAVHSRPVWHRAGSGRHFQAHPLVGHGLFLRVRLLAAVVPEAHRQCRQDGYRGNKDRDFHGSEPPLLLG